MEISRGSIYYKKKERGARDKEKIKYIREIHEKYSFYGYRRISCVLKKERGKEIGEKVVRRLMKASKIKALQAKSRTSIANKENKKYEYLLKGYEVRFPNQLWETDITYVRVKGQRVYLSAIIDVYSRKILSWRISNSMDTSLCVSVLEDALYKYGIPAVFNSDQGSQYTSKEFTKILTNKKVRISMDSKGRALDNIFIERFWKTVKYEDIKFRYYGDMSELKEGIREYIEFYNDKRPHQSLGYNTPNEIYEKPFSYCKEIKSA